MANNMKNAITLNGKTYYARTPVSITGFDDLHHYIHRTQWDEYEHLLDSLCVDKLPIAMLMEYVSKNHHASEVYNLYHYTRHATDEVIMASQMNTVMIGHFSGLWTEPYKIKAIDWTHSLLITTFDNVVSFAGVTVKQFKKMIKDFSLYSIPGTGDSPEQHCVPAAVLAQYTFGSNTTIKNNGNYFYWGSNLDKAQRSIRMKLLAERLEEVGMFFPHPAFLSPFEHKYNDKPWFMLPEEYSHLVTTEQKEIAMDMTRAEHVLREKYPDRNKFSAGEIYNQMSLAHLDDLVGKYLIMDTASPDLYSAYRLTVGKYLSVSTVSKDDAYDEIKRGKASKSKQCQHYLKLPKTYNKRGCQVDTSYSGMFVREEFLCISLACISDLEYKVTKQINYTPVYDYISPLIVGKVRQTEICFDEDDCEYIATPEAINHAVKRIVNDKRVLCNIKRGLSTVEKALNRSPVKCVPQKLDDADMKKYSIVSELIETTKQINNWNSDEWDIPYHQSCTEEKLAKIASKYRSKYEDTWVIHHDKIMHVDHVLYTDYKGDGYAAQLCENTSRKKYQYPKIILVGMELELEMFRNYVYTDNRYLHFPLSSKTCKLECRLPKQFTQVEIVERFKKYKDAMINSYKQAISRFSKDIASVLAGNTIGFCTIDYKPEIFKSIHSK